MKDQLLEKFRHLSDEELSTLASTATSPDRRETLIAVLRHRESERTNPTPETQKPRNYTLIHSHRIHTGEDAKQVAIFRTWTRPDNVDQDDPPHRFDYDHATPEQIDQYERQIAGEAERAAIAEAAESNGIHFRPETPPSDYSPTGRRFFSAVSFTQIDDFLFLIQHSAIDN